jgi:hypothetical protein
MFCFVSQYNNSINIYQTVQSYDYESWCCKVMEQHEKTPHKDLEIFVQRERIVKPGRNLPPQKQNLTI